MRIFTVFIFLVINFFVHAQTTTEQNLALQYYQNEEYEKAVELLEKLYSKDPSPNLYYRYYYNTLLKLKQYDKLGKILKKNIKHHPEDIFYVVDLGNVFKTNEDIKAAEAEFNKALKLLTPNEMQITQTANAFISYGELDYAVKTFLAGQELYRSKYEFAFSLAELYERKGDMTKAIAAYLDFVAMNANNVQTVQNRLQEALFKHSVFDIFKNDLLERIQGNNAPMVYSDLLIWAFIQRKDFKSAFIQTKAIDKRLNENGWRVMNLARSAVAEKQYDAAIDAFQYVIQKGKTNPNYLQAKQELLQARKTKITEQRTDIRNDVLALNNDYNEFLKEFGINRNTVSALLEQARLQAFHLHNLDSAIAITEAVVNLPAADKNSRGEAKLDLGDYYLMAGDMYEPVLLYTQVEKDFKDQPTAELARFKNAKLSYYKGDFEWAQAQMNILKTATSELVANDALELSVFITDNLGLDTTAYPMEMFAKADLLYYQNKTQLALATVDSVNDIYPNHALADDIFLFKAKVYHDEKKDSIAATYLEKILALHKEDILADDATFMLAELNETSFNNPEKAKQLYEDLMMNFKDSIYITEARKRYRRLRGDAL
jgi:tetratricopeptide (TPR) repeat protein